MPAGLSLHHLSVLDASPLELVAIACRTGCSSISLFTHVPERAQGFYPEVRGADVPTLRAALADSGVSVCNLEVFPLDSDESPDRYRSALEVGAALGATRATAHIHGTDEVAAASERFAGFCRAAQDCGLVAGLEFNAFSAVRGLTAAAAIVRAAGAGSVVLDTLHLMRGGGGLAAVAAAVDLIDYVQLSDGPPDIDEDARWHEAVRERMLPGDGAFPLDRLLRPLLDRAVIEIEIPRTAARKAGVPPLERARVAVDATRALIARMQQTEVPA